MGEACSVNPGAHLAPIGCWTCKSRRVRCDRNLPSCLNCTRVRRKCQAYGKRLSWPRENDPKRAKLGNSPWKCKTGTKLLKQLHIIQTSFWDMEMHNYLSGQSTRGMPDLMRFLPGGLFVPHLSSLKPHSLDQTDFDLVHYFASTASSSLVAFDTAGLRDLLIQMALSDGTVSSTAVLFALLAVSSQHRDGLQSRAFYFKTSAISALAKSVGRGALGTIEATQHVAAGMLLCSFEIETSSETSGQWLLYIRGIKDVVEAHHLDRRTNENSVAKLIDWVHYHDVMAQFSVLHWLRSPVETAVPNQLGAIKWGNILGSSRPLLVHSARPFHHVLQFLSEIFNALYQAFERGDSIDTLKCSLNILEGKAGDVEELIRNNGRFSTEKSNVRDMIKLYQMVAMIYLARVSESISGEIWNPQPLLDDAFDILCGMHTCELQFPLLILGYEARTDERRMQMLNLVQRTMGRSVSCLRMGLEALWIQEDLVADQECVPKYTDRLSAIITSRRFIPSLV